MFKYLTSFFIFISFVNQALHCRAQLNICHNILLWSDFVGCLEDSVSTHLQLGDELLTPNIPTDNTITVDIPISKSIYFGIYGISNQFDETFTLILNDGVGDGSLKIEVLDGKLYKTKFELKMISANFELNECLLSGTCITVEGCDSVNAEDSPISVEVNSHLRPLQFTGTDNLVTIHKTVNTVSITSNNFFSSRTQPTLRGSSSNVDDTTDKLGDTVDTTDKLGDTADTTGLTLLYYGESDGTIAQLNDYIVNIKTLKMLTTLMTGGNPVNSLSVTVDLDDYSLGFFDQVIQGSNDVYIYAEMISLPSPSDRANDYFILVDNVNRADVTLISGSVTSSYHTFLCTNVEDANVQIEIAGGFVSTDTALLYGVNVVASLHLGPVEYLSDNISDYPSLVKITSKIATANVLFGDGATTGEQSSICNALFGIESTISNVNIHGHSATCDNDGQHVVIAPLGYIDAGTVNYDIYLDLRGEENVECPTESLINWQWTNANYGSATGRLLTYVDCLLTVFPGNYYDTYSTSSYYS